MKPRDIEIPLPRGLVAARLWGDETLPTVLALHGWLDNAASFDALAPLLPGRHLLCIDLAGHGHSAHRPAGMAYHLLDYVIDVVDLLDTLGERPLTLLGHSLGGAVAAAVAAVLPRRVQRLALLESLGALTNPANELLEMLSRHVAARRLLGTKQRVRYSNLEEPTRQRMKAGGISEKAARVLVARNLKKVDGGLQWRSDPALRLPSAQRLTEEQLGVLLAGIECPTMVVRAREGFQVPEEIYVARARKVRDLTLVEVDGGHHVHLEHPERVAPYLEAFLPRGAA